ncbi:hypothetical protein [Nocardia cyriacigeorgica]|uniref:hypothetical protein n=1 Tax=Nocardia cyriacigeorgica TaxID=135487 RepID=UPI0024558BA9|nr:hypothetical protein [Nocardia cyriacigeorgica]
MSSTSYRGTVRKILATTALAGALALVPAAVAPQIASALPGGAAEKVSTNRGDSHGSSNGEGSRGSGYGDGRGYGQTRGYGQGRGYGKGYNNGLRNSSSTTDSDNKPGYSSRCHGECGPD